MKRGYGSLLRVEFGLVTESAGKDARATRKKSLAVGRGVVLNEELLPGRYLGGQRESGRQDAGVFSTTRVSAATVRPASIQYSAGWPLNKKAEATMANAKTSDQRMAELGFT